MLTKRKRRKVERKRQAAKRRVKFLSLSRGGPLYEQPGRATKQLGHKKMGAG